jgi:hypothetical protein
MYAEVCPFCHLAHGEAQCNVCITQDVLGDRARAPDLLEGEGIGQVRADGWHVSGPTGAAFGSSFDPRNAGAAAGVGLRREGMSRTPRVATVLSSSELRNMLSAR